ncbi:MAG: carbon starvation CstA family protein [Alphaproteobacteria bacterium]
MTIFLLSTLALILGYIIYGAFIEKILKVSPNRLMPAEKYADGVDFVKMSPQKAFLIQFLNIAGLGPVFGAILGALYGPICLLWIVLGSIFAGGVHDFLAGILSVRNKGRTIIFLVNLFFGKVFKALFLFVLTIFLIMVGAIFAQTPAHMLADMTSWSFEVWLSIVFGYYFLATLLPIDKIIGRFYPVFSVCLIVSSILLLIVLFVKGGNFYPDLTTINQHPKDLPIFPLMFITIACGAISGFHATQSPLMARCLTNEKYARPIFYGAMILEGFIALIWATLGIAFYQSTDALQTAINSGGAGIVVSQISKGFLGHWGSVLTVFAIISLTITSGDTALRSARIFCADLLKLEQKSIVKRLSLTIFVLAGGVLLSFVDITKIWVYFGWANQILACFMLWIGTLYLRRKRYNYWISFIPALFMTSVCAAYFFYSPILLNLDIKISQICGILFALLCGALFFVRSRGELCSPDKQ